VGNNIVAVASRNSAGNGDVALIQGDTNNNILVPPPIRQAEIAAPTGILGSDLLWADSTAHRWKMVNNNGSLVAVAATSGDTFTTTTLTSPTVNTPSFSAMCNNNNTGCKAQRFGASCTTGAGSGSLCDTTFTWTVAFADASYTVVCQGGVVASGAPVIVQTKTVAAASFIITILNPTGVAAQLTSVECIGIHD
jgi:hypothetical protein